MYIVACDFRPWNPHKNKFSTKRILLCQKKKKKNIYAFSQCQMQIPLINEHPRDLWNNSVIKIRLVFWETTVSPCPYINCGSPWIFFLKHCYWKLYIIYIQIFYAYLDKTFPNRWIERRGPIEWPTRSPDLTPLDYFLWDH